MLATELSTGISELKNTPQPQESGDRAFPVDMRFRSTELGGIIASAGRLACYDKSYTLERPMCRTAGSDTWKSLILS